MRLLTPRNHCVTSTFPRSLRGLHVVSLCQLLTNCSVVLLASLPYQVTSYALAERAITPTPASDGRHCFNCRSPSHMQRACPLLRPTNPLGTDQRTSAPGNSLPADTPTIIEALPRLMLSSSLDILGKLLCIGLDTHVTCGPSHHNNIVKSSRE